MIRDNSDFSVSHKYEQNQQEKGREDTIKKGRNCSSLTRIQYKVNKDVSVHWSYLLNLLTPPSTKISCQQTYINLYTHFNHNFFCLVFIGKELVQDPPCTPATCSPSLTVAFWVLLFSADGRMYCSFLQVILSLHIPQYTIPIYLLKNNRQIKAMNFLTSGIILSF